MTFQKKYLWDLLAVVLFAIIAFAYFMPADMDGRILYREDASAGRGAGEETRIFQEQTGEHSRWTNSLFSGMPTYQISPSYDSTTTLSQVAKAYHLWLPDYVWYLFAYLLGFYILLRAFDFRRELAVLGSLIWAFSSYFLIIIAAGHIWKVMALAYLPPMIGGVVLAYRGKYLWGAVVTAIFSALEVQANHVQMTYYYLFIIFFMVVGFLVDAIRQKKMGQFLKATGACALGALIGISINLSSLYHTWQYGKESMRGKSELVKKDAANQTSSGLDRSYITQWSYGIDETMTLLVPQAKGGMSAPLSMNKDVMKHADNSLTEMNVYDAFTQYFGSQPGTSGPVYVGAFVLFLFILGIFIVKGSVKWALLAATVLSILLSWGHNFMGFTNFFLDYVPMYSKFRTVASILVIAEFTIPLLAVMALKRIVDEPELFSLRRKSVIASLVLTAGVALLVAVFPSMMGPFISGNEISSINGATQGNTEMAQMIISGVENARRGMVTSDAWRSIIIILIGVAMLMLYAKRKLKTQYMVGLVAVLCLVDMWQVDKRYLYDDMFVEKSRRDQPQQMSDVDQQILRDKSLDYRVLNLATNTFNENETSYYHKSIGGYSAAKLQRYQDMIDHYIQPEMQSAMKAIAEAGGDMTKVDGVKAFPVLNMLNTKYLILPLQNGQRVALMNPYAFGNAWFVDNIKYVANANEEIDGMRGLDLRHSAVADKKFEATLGKAAQQDDTSVARLTSYKPNNLVYDVNSAKGGVLVFSEIYYPEWTATVDGQLAELGRVNYVLRALSVKPGHHTVVLDFHPKSIKTTETIAYVGYGAIVLLIIIGVIEWRRKKAKA